MIFNKNIKFEQKNNISNKIKVLQPSYNCRKQDRNRFSIQEKMFFIFYFGLKYKKKRNFKVEDK